MCSFYKCRFQSGQWAPSLCRFRFHPRSSSCCESHKQDYLVTVQAIRWVQAFWSRLWDHLHWHQVRLWFHTTWKSFEFTLSKDSKTQKQSICSTYQNLVPDDFPLRRDHAHRFELMQCISPWFWLQTNDSSKRLLAKWTLCSRLKCVFVNMITIKLWFIKRQCIYKQINHIPGIIARLSRNPLQAALIALPI